MNELNWSLLRSFLAVVEEGSLSAAGARLSMTQPTLGRHIRELEATLEVVLFVRTVRGLEPTPPALTLIADAQRMGEAATSLALKAQGGSQALTGTVRVAASVVMATMMLPPILADLRRTEPGIQIELVASDTAQNLLRRDADIAIRMFQPTQGALIARKLGEAPIGLFATHDYFARRGRPSDLASLAGHELIGFDRSEAIIAAYAARGLLLTREDFTLRCDDPMAYLHLILAGVGIGIAQTLVARRYPDLDQLDLDLQLPSMPVWLVMHEDVRNNARIRLVAEYLGAGVQAALLKEK